MPSRKARSKEDTWTTEELDNALMDDREKQRKERREKRERKDKSNTRDDKHNQKNSDDADKRKRREKDDERRKERTTDDRDRGAERKRREKDDERRKERNTDDRDRDAEREDRRKRREGTSSDNKKKQSKGDHSKHRREKEEERKISDKHRSRDVTNDEEREKTSDRHKSRGVNDERERRSDRHENERDKRRHERHKEGEINGDKAKDPMKSDKHKSNRDDDDREHKRHRERRDLKEAKSSTIKEEPSSSNKNGRHDSDAEEEKDNDYNYDDDDFEDYEEDFEEEDDTNDDFDKEYENRPENRELSDVLKALDEENARLAAGSAGSYRSDSSVREKHDNKQSRPSNISRGRTFINFVSAKQRAVDQKVSNKTKKRGQDLLKLIEFDKAGYDMFDLPPVKEYDLYIRSFGRTDTKQAYVQTNEDNLDRDIQTEDIEYRDKWTQHPAEDLLGCGGEGIDSTGNTETSDISKQDVSRMSVFLTKAVQAISILLNEENKSSDNTDNMGSKSNLSVSNGYTVLGSPLILQGRHVNYASYSPSQPNMLLTSFSAPQQLSDNQADTKGIICVWNIMELSNPQKILACESQPICCCFSPMKTTLACAGMDDGSIVIWDLREQASMHHLLKFQQEEFLVRYPTYNTAGMLESENHHSPVRTLIPVYSDPTSSQSKQEPDDVSGLSFQLVSLEEDAYVNLWVVAEIPVPDSAGSEIDLGLSPGGRVKLVKSSTIKLNIPHQSDHGHHLQAYEFQLSQCDLNHFYVGTDTGFVVHGVRFGSSAFPRGHSSILDTPVKVKSIDFSPFGYPYLLAGSSDGSVQLFHTKLENPLVYWNDLSNGKANSICSVRWSRSRAGVFFVLDDQSTLYTFDLLEGDSRPVNVDNITSGRAVCMVLNNDSGIIASGSSSRSPQLLLALDNGITELHNIKNFLLEQQTLESEFLNKYNERL